MIRALVTGSLYGDPQARTSQAGKPFTTAKLRADGKDGASVWCSLIAFGELAERLATLKENQALAVSGRAEVNGWLDKSGNPAAGLSLVVDELATLKPQPRPQGEGAPPQRPVPQRHAPPVVAGFDDELPGRFNQMTLASVIPAVCIPSCLKQLGKPQYWILRFLSHTSQKPAMFCATIP